MPPVVALVLAYVAGLSAGGVVSSRLSLAGALAALIGAGVVWRQWPWRAVLLGAVAAGLLQGRQSAATLSDGCAARWVAGRQAAVLQLNDAPDPRGLATARVRFSPHGCTGDVRLRLAEGAAPSGATLLAVGRYAPGGALRIERFRVLSRSRPVRFVMRDWVSLRITRTYGPRAPLVDALVLDRKGAIDPRLRSDFAASGLAHLLAISGLHVGIVAGWVLLLARAAGLRRHAWSLAVAASWGYVALLGFPAPATRSAAFVLIQAMARRSGRHPGATATLAVTVLVVVLLDPLAVRSIGAWLSVAAVTGTGAAGAVLKAVKVRGSVGRLLGTSVGATVATAPITAFAFGAVAPIGIVANLVAVPLAAIAQPAVFASLLLSPVAPGAGLALAGLERVAALAAAVPGGHIESDPGVRFALPWVALMLAGAWWYRRRPTWRVLRVRAAGVVALGAWLAVATGVRWPGGGYDGLTIHALSVGQGDAIALRTPHGRWVLVDAGPRLLGEDAGRRLVVPFLRRHGARALDAVIVSHAHDDHLGGIPAVLERLPATVVLDPGQPVASPLYLEYLGMVDRSGAGWRAARAGDTLMVDGVRLAVLHPTTAWMRHETDLNENSVVVRVSYGDFDAVLTGDAGWPAESALAGTVGRIELLKVGHHGSAGGTRAPWVAELGPRVAVVSAGRGNRYGHPAPDVLARLDRAGVAVYRTDHGGTVTIRSNGRYFEVSQGDPRPIFVRWSCTVRDWLPSRASSSSRSGCTPRPRGSSPTSYTTWPSPPR